MKALKSSVTKGLTLGSKVPTCDNSGAKILRVFGAVIVRQKKEYRRVDGTRIKFEDNAAVVLKDDKGNPKGTRFKGAIAKEACERWPGIAKLARIVV